MDAPTQSERWLRALAHESLAKILVSPAGFLSGLTVRAVAPEENLALIMALVEPTTVTVWEPAPEVEPALGNPLRHLRENELNILEASPAFGQPLIRIADLRERAGYGANRHFDRALDRLLDLELLVRLSSGIRKSRTFEEKTK